MSETKALSHEIYTYIVEKLGHTHDYAVEIWTKWLSIQTTLATFNSNSSSSVLPMQKEQCQIIHSRFTSIQMYGNHHLLHLSDERSSSCKLTAEKWLLTFWRQSHRMDTVSRTHHDGFCANWNNHNAAHRYRYFRKRFISLKWLSEYHFSWYQTDGASENFPFGSALFCLWS